MKKPVSELSRRIGYTFRDPDLLEQAIRHRSAGNPHNERLEFLGDAVLGFVVAQRLYERLPDASEGYLTRLRASLVNGHRLANIARDLELGDFLSLGSGELKSGGASRSSILTGALEALIGGVFIDGGVEAAIDLVGRLYAAGFDELPGEDELKDPKTRLQEYLQGRNLALPVYTVEELHGEPHARTFTVRCEIGDLGQVVTAQGRSRQKAEQAAAAALLDELNVG